MRQSGFAFFFGSARLRISRSRYLLGRCAAVVSLQALLARLLRLADDHWDGVIAD